MAEEAAMLGVPSVFLNNASTYYTQHLEKDYQLMYNLTESEEDQKKAIQIGIDLLKQTDQNVWKDRRDKMLRDKIDVTAFLCWLVSNYPKCKLGLKEYPDFQYRFK